MYHVSLNPNEIDQVLIEFINASKDLWLLIIKQNDLLCDSSGSLLVATNRNLFH